MRYDRRTCAKLCWWRFRTDSVFAWSLVETTENYLGGKREIKKEWMTGCSGEPSSSPPLWSAHRSRCAWAGWPLTSHKFRHPYSRLSPHQNPDFCHSKATSFVASLRNRRAISQVVVHYDHATSVHLTPTFAPHDLRRYAERRTMPNLHMRFVFGAEFTQNHDQVNSA